MNTKAEKLKTLAKERWYYVFVIAILITISMNVSDYVLHQVLGYPVRLKVTNTGVVRADEITQITSTIDFPKESNTHRGE